MIFLALRIISYLTSLSSLHPLVTGYIQVFVVQVIPYLTMFIHLCIGVDHLALSFESSHGQDLPGKQRRNGHNGYGNGYFQPIFCY